MQLFLLWSLLEDFDFPVNNRNCLLKKKNGIRPKTYFGFGKVKKLIMNKPGIAVDIDETLSQTLPYWFGEMQRLFGNPENMGIAEMIKKYRYFQNVPYWKSEEIYKKAHEFMDSNELQTKLPTMPGSVEGLNLINNIIPVVAYITNRPIIVRSGTKTWLEAKGFPMAEIIHRPDEVDILDGNKWKGAKLAELYPDVVGIIEDNAAILKFLPEGYQGTIYLFDNKELPFEAWPGIAKYRLCPTWEDVVAAIKKDF